MKRKVMNLKESIEGYIGGFEREKGKRKNIVIIL